MKEKAYFLSFYIGHLEKYCFTETNDITLRSKSLKNLAKNLKLFIKRPDKYIRNISLYFYDVECNDCVDYNSAVYIYSNTDYKTLKKYFLNNGIKL